MTKDVEHSTAYCTLELSYLGNCQFKYPTHLKNCVVCLLIIDCKSSSCILDTNLLSDIYFENIFLFVVYLYLFIFLMLSFKEQSILSWSPIYFLISFFFCVIYFCLINKFCVLQGCEDIFLSSRTFIILYSALLSILSHFCILCELGQEQYLLFLVVVFAFLLQGQYI